LLESKEVFENTILAHDFLTLEVWVLGKGAI
jgi:hypothetical protein